MAGKNHEAFLFSRGHKSDARLRILTLYRQLFSGQLFLVFASEMARFKPHPQAFSAITGMLKTWHCAKFHLASNTHLRCTL